MDAIEFLLVFDLREVAHDVRDHRIDGLLEARVVDVNREADVKRLDGGFVFETVLDEAMDLAST